MHRLYENEDLVVFWNSEKCFHAKKCVTESLGLTLKEPTIKKYDRQLKSVRPEPLVVFTDIILMLNSILRTVAA